MLPDWVFPVLSLLGGIGCATWYLSWMISDRFAKQERLTYENRQAVAEVLASHRAQIAESLEAIRSRLLKLEYLANRVERSKILGDGH